MGSTRQTSTETWICGDWYFSRYASILTLQQKLAPLRAQSIARMHYLHWVGERGAQDSKKGVWDTYQ